MKLLFAFAACIWLLADAAVLGVLIAAVLLS
jgi:hypothetical protein